LPEALFRSISSGPKITWDRGVTFFTNYTFICPPSFSASSEALLKGEAQPLPLTPPHVHVPVSSLFFGVCVKSEERPPLYCLVSGRQSFNVLILPSYSDLSSNASYRYNCALLVITPPPKIHPSVFGEPVQTD